jgi:hypothetical protein
MELKMGESSQNSVLAKGKRTGVPNWKDDELNCFFAVKKSFSASKYFQI